MVKKRVMAHIRSLRKATILTNLSMLEALVDAALVLPVRRVEVVLDAVVGAAWEFLGDVGPFVTQLLVQVENLLFLLSVDRIFVDVGI